jgi:hypothetical protein
MLAPAMSPGSVRALLPTRALFASMLHRSFARPRGAPLLFVLGHWYAAGFPCAISVRCRVHAVDVAIGWARRFRLFEGCWSHGAALAVASTSVVHVHAEPHAPMHAPSASMHSQCMRVVCQLRFVLAWAARPNDLDIHLQTPTCASVSVTPRPCLNGHRSARFAPCAWFRCPTSNRQHPRRPIRRRRISRRVFLS